MSCSVIIVSSSGRCSSLSAPIVGKPRPMAGPPNPVPVARFLKAGRNVVAVKATNEAGPGGALVQITIGRGKTRRVIVSNSDWRAAEKAPEAFHRREPIWIQLHSETLVPRR